MSDTELFEQLTELIIWQANIIKQQRDIIAQARLTTSIDEGVKNVQSAAEKLVDWSEGH